MCAREVLVLQGKERKGGKGVARGRFGRFMMRLREGIVLLRSLPTSRSWMDSTSR